MKRIKREFIKTEASVCQNFQEAEYHNEWVQLSTQRQKKLSCTPLRFANLTLKTKTKEKENPSTQDREKSSNQRPSYPVHKKSSITEAIKVLKQLSNGSQQQNIPERNSITPFQLVNQDSFEPEISFKGVSNRLYLLNQIQKIQKEVQLVQNKTQILYFKEKGKDSSMNAKSIKPHKQKNGSQVQSHLKSMFKDQQQFLVQLQRCKSIMETQPGISEKSVSIYINRFQSLISNIKTNMNCLQKYMELDHGPVESVIKKIKISKFNGW